MSMEGQRLSVEDAVAALQEAATNNVVCLGAEGFWLRDNRVEPSLDHILDLSSVTGRSPRTNASLAVAVIERWPDDPAAFAVELVMVSDDHPCPCCGHLTLNEPPGSYGICAVCFWEDDAVQLRWPTYPGGANKPCLIDSQQNYIHFGAMEERFVRHVRPALDVEPVDKNWVPADVALHDFESPLAKDRDWPQDLTTLYWWRPTFWRSRGGA